MCVCVYVRARIRIAPRHNQYVYTVITIATGAYTLA
jgi:hypothetical protein